MGPPPDGVADIRGSRELAAPCPCGQKAGHTVRQKERGLFLADAASEGRSKIANQGHAKWSLMRRSTRKVCWCI